MSTSIAIIGGGIAGLSAGCYARMNGYQTHIFEQHDEPGGLCTSWHRGEYTFDGCLEWLVGTAEKGGFHRMWRELGVIGGRPVVHHEEFLRFEGSDGRMVVFYTDPARLTAHLKTLSPADEPLIQQLAQSIEHFRSFQPILERPHGFLAVLEHAGKLLEMTKLAPDFVRYARTSSQDFAARFRDPLLREAFSSLFDLPDFPFIGMVATLAWHANHDAGYPVGGSLAFARDIEQRYRGLGGQISYGARVRRIVVEADRAVGVQLDNGQLHHADQVISAADGHATIFQLLEGKYVDHILRQRYGTLPRFPSLVRVSLGVARDLRDTPQSVSFVPRATVTVDGQPRTRIRLRHYCYDPTLAPPGKSVLSVSLPASYEAWRTLAQQPELYAAEKQRIGREVIAAIEQRLPGISAQVEQLDVATPMTYERYTGNWLGSMEGWLLTTQSMTMRMSDTLPGLSGLRMIGQWVQPGGGVPTAAWSGRNAIRAQCRQDNKPFETKLAGS